VCIRLNDREEKVKDNWKKVGKLKKQPRERLKILRCSAAVVGLNVEVFVSCHSHSPIHSKLVVVVCTCACCLGPCRHSDTTTTIRKIYFLISFCKQRAKKKKKVQSHHTRERLRETWNHKQPPPVSLSRH